MNIYYYFVDPDRYDSFETDGRSETQINRVLGRRRGVPWTPPRVYRAHDTGTLGDFSTFAGTHLPILSPRAWTALEPALGRHVEPLPLRCREGRYVAVNPLHVNHCLDPKRSWFRYFSSGEVAEIEKIVLKPKARFRCPMFRVPQDAGQVFLTEEFFDLADAAGLEGLLKIAVPPVTNPYWLSR